MEDEFQKRLENVMRELRHHFPNMGFVLMVSDFESITRFGSNLNIASQKAMFQVALEALDKDGLANFKQLDEESVN